MLCWSHETNNSWTTKYALIRSQNIYNDGFKEEGLVFISPEDADKLSYVDVKNFDILLNITGDSVARVCMAPNGVLPARVNQHVAIIRPSPKDFDATYVRYYLSSPIVQNELLTIASTGATRKALTKRDIESLAIPKPSLNIQRRIANHLRSLDDKIQINYQINQTLEQMAQAIFKSWFVDFEPVKAKIAALEMGGNVEDANLAAMQAISGKTLVELEQLKAENSDHYQQLHATAQYFPTAMQSSELGEIPEGWRTGLLAELCLLNPENWSTKTLPKTIHYVDLANAKNGEIIEFRTLYDKAIPSRARRILKPGDTIVGTVRPGNKSFALVGESNLTGSTGFAALRPIAEQWLEFVYLVATSDCNIERLAHLADGGAYPAVHFDVVTELNIVIPKESFAKTFNQSVLPFFQTIFANKNQNKKLKIMRDILLPKLLSGELQTRNTQSQAS